MKTGRRGMAITGWAMTLIGSGIVLVWLLIEAHDTFSSAPLQTVVGIVVVLGLLALLIPVPLIIATRRAKASRSLQRS